MNLTFDLDCRLGTFRLAASARCELDGITALYGPSGAGKSSVLAALAGFLPEAGTVRCGGELWQDQQRSLPARRRPVSLVFQDGRLFGHLDVAANLAFAQRHARRGGPQIDYDEVVSACALAELLSQRTATLSGGEIQRVAIGRALLSRPHLLLLDEGISGLDATRREQVVTLLQSLPNRFGCQVLLVSHQLEDIARAADDLLVIDNGQIVAAGPLAAVLPDLDDRLAGEAGPAALVTGEVVANSKLHGLTRITVGAGECFLPVADPGPAPATVRLLLRARDVAIAATAPSNLSIRNQLPARVVALDGGPGVFVDVRLDSGGQYFTARLTRHAVAELRLAPGAEVVALVKTAALI